MVAAARSAAAFIGERFFGSRPTSERRSRPRPADEPITDIPFTESVHRKPFTVLHMAPPPIRPYDFPMALIWYGPLALLVSLLAADAPGSLASVTPGTSP